MKSQLNKILKITFVILFFTLSKSYSIEDLSELTDAISEAREEFDQVPLPQLINLKLLMKHLKKLIKQQLLLKRLSVMIILKTQLKH